MRVAEDTSGDFDLGTRQLQYNDGTSLIDATPSVEANQPGFIEVELVDVVTDRIRLVVEPAPGASIGVAELEVYAATPVCNAAGDDCVDCVPDDYICDRQGRLWQCQTDGLGFELSEECGNQSACDAALGTCD